MKFDSISANTSFKYSVRTITMDDSCETIRKHLTLMAAIDYAQTAVGMDYKSVDLFDEETGEVLFSYYDVIEIED